MTPDNARIGGEYLQPKSSNERAFRPDLISPGADVEISGSCEMGGDHFSLTRQVPIKAVSFHRNEASMGNPVLTINDMANNSAVFDWGETKTYTLSINTQKPNEDTVPWEECDLRDSANGYITTFNRTNKKININPDTLGNEKNKTGETREYSATCYVHRDLWDRIQVDAGSVTLTRKKPRIADRLSLAGSCFKPTEKNQYHPGDTATIPVTQALAGDKKNVTVTLLPPDKLWSTQTCPASASNVSVGKSGDSCISTFSTNANVRGDWKIIAGDVEVRTVGELEMNASSHEGSANGETYILDRKPITIMPQVDLSMPGKSMTVLPEGDPLRVLRPDSQYILSVASTLKASSLKGAENSRFEGMLKALNVTLPPQLTPDLTQKITLVLGGKPVDVSSRWDGKDNNTNVLANTSDVKNGTSLLLSIPVRVTSERSDSKNAGIVMSTDIQGVSADVRTQPAGTLYSLNFGDGLPAAEKVYTLEMNSQEPLRFSPEIPVKNVAVKFSTHNGTPVSHTGLWLTLPVGLERSGDITVTCSLTPDCPYSIDNTWTGTGDHSLIIKSIDTKPDEDYSLTVPVKLKENSPEKMGELEASIGQADDIRADAAERVVAPGSLYTRKKGVTVESRGTVTVHELSGKLQTLKDEKTFIAQVVVENTLPDDTLTLKSGSQTWPASRQAACSVKKATCFSVELPVPDNPFTYGLSAELTDKDGKPLSSTTLIRALAPDTVSFAFTMACKDIDSASGCSLAWGTELNPVAIPYRAADNWLTLSALSTNGRIAPTAAEALKQLISEGGGSVHVREESTSWSPLQLFDGNGAFEARKPAVNDKVMDGNDKNGIIKPGETLPNYGTLHFHYE